MKKQISKIVAFLLALTVAFTLLPADAQAAPGIKLNKSKVTIYTGGTTTLRVTGTSRKVSFSSNRKSVAVVNNKGIVTAKKPGAATITAKVGSKKLTCKVTVKKENSKLSKSKVTLYTSGTTTLKVTGTSRKARFTSSNKSVAPVSSSGKITAKKAGTATITAKVGSKKLTCKVTVKKENLKLDKSSLTLYVGKTATLKATGTSRKVSFSTSNKSVATVSSSGKITAKKAGTATITAKGGSKKVTCKVTVKAKEQANMEITVYWNGEKSIKATGAAGTVTWESSNNSIAPIKSTGTTTAMLTGKKVGRTTITAKVNGKTFKKYTVNVKIKTTPLTQKEKDLAFYIQDKYDWPDTFTSSSELKKFGFVREEIDNVALWNTHNRAVNTARKLMPGREVYICDVDTWQGAGDKKHELQKKGMKYAYSATISHDHGKTEKWSVMWIK